MNNSLVNVVEEFVQGCEVYVVKLKKLSKSEFSKIRGKIAICNEFN
jgi:hypothetical protein